MPRRQLLGLVALLVAQPGYAGNASNVVEEEADARGLGLLSGLKKAVAPKSSAPAPAQAQVSSKAAAAIATAKKLYNPLMAKAFAAMCKLSYCGPGPTALAPYGNPDVFPELVSNSCGAFCTDAGFTLGKVLMVSEPNYGQKNADFSYVSEVKPVMGKPPPPMKCTVAFRGTWVNPANGNTNDDHNLTDLVTPSCKPGAGCQVVSGSYTMLQQMMPSIVKNLQMLGCKKGAPISVTGHSLGGQLAAIAMFILQDVEGYKVAPSYTFEAPKPFNQKAVEVFESVIGSGGVSFFRMTNTNDKVAVFPPSKKIMTPGFQVWFTDPGNENSYQFCGNQLDAPTCGILSIPSDQMCKMSGGNPDWLECGGNAPYNGPHCGIAVAPQGNICSFAGMGPQSDFVSQSIATCMYGNVMTDQATGPQSALQVFPPENVPTTTAAPTTTVPPPPPKAGKTAGAAPKGPPTIPGAPPKGLPKIPFMLPKLPPMKPPAKPTPAPTPAPLKLPQVLSQSFAKMASQYKEKGKSMPKHVDCFARNTMASPVSMFGHYGQIMDSVYDCQERCQQTAYCEMFNYFDFAAVGGKGGNCELVGGWGAYVPNMLGSTAGPKDCKTKPPQLTDPQKYQLLAEYMAYIGPQYDNHYTVEDFEQHAGGLEGLPDGQKFTLGQVLCIGTAMLALGACLTLLVARTGRLGSLLGARRGMSQMVWNAVDERGLVSLSPEE